MSPPEVSPRRRGRRPKLRAADEPTVLKCSVLQQWSQRKAAQVLCIDRARIQAAVEAGQLTAEPKREGQKLRRVLAIEAVELFAPHLLTSKRIKFL